MRRPDDDSPMMGQKSSMESAMSFGSESSWRSEESQVDPVTIGTIWVKKAKAGSDQWVDKCSEEQLNSYMLAKRMKAFGWIAKYGLVVLPLFDRPAICAGTPENCAALDRHVYSIGFPTIPLWVSLTVAIALYTIMICRMNLRRWAMGAAYDFHGWHMATSFFIWSGMLTTVLCFAWPDMLPFSIIFRPLAFVGRSKDLRTGVVDILRCLPGFWDVLFSFIACVAIAVWIGMVLFPGTSEGTIDFYSWGDGFAKLWTGYTTANSPNFYIPALNQNRWYFVFFFIYMTVTLFLLSNVLLARVYDSYKDSLKEKYNKMRENQELSSDRAFFALADPATQTITAETWDRFVISICDPYMGLVTVGSPEDTKYNSFRLNAIFKLFHGIDIEKMGSIDRKCWKQILGVIFDRDIYIPTRRPPRIGSSPIADFFTTGTDIQGVRVVWDKVMDAMIFVGTCIAFFLSISFAAAKTTPNLMDLTLYWFLFCFSVFYFVGLNTKIICLGLEHFWYRKPLQHRFDFGNVYLLLAVEIGYMTVWHTDSMARCVILLHMCRALRLFVYIEPMKQLFVIIRQLIPTFRQVLMILLVVYYIFSVVGRWLFGGLIYTTNPALVGTGFADGLFWSLTFNDVVSGMITLFLCMLVNNWYVIADGYMLTSGTIWCGVFFFTWYVVANFIMINIVVAVILDGTGVVSQMSEERENAEANTNKSEAEMLQSVAGDHSAQYMLRQILDEEDDVFALKTETSRRSLTMLTPDPSQKRMQRHASAIC